MTLWTIIKGNRMRCTRAEHGVVYSGTCDIDR